MYEAPPSRWRRLIALVSRSASRYNRPRARWILSSRPAPRQRKSCGIWPSNHSTTAVELPGEFSLRGGILDIFAPDADEPVRIELFGDEVESIRAFDVATQRSLGDARRGRRHDARSRRRRIGRTSRAYLPAGSWFMLIEPNELREEGKFYLDGWIGRRFFALDDAGGDLQVSVGDGGGRAGGVDGDDGPLGVRVGRAVQRRHGQGPRRAGQGERRAKVYLLRDGGGGRAAGRSCSAIRSCAAEGRLHFVVGHLAPGFRIVPPRVVLVSAAELFQRQDLARDDAAAAGAGDR